MLHSCSERKSLLIDLLEAFLSSCILQLHLSQQQVNSNYR